MSKSQKERQGKGVKTSALQCKWKSHQSFLELRTVQQGFMSTLVGYLCFGHQLDSMFQVDSLFRIWCEQALKNKRVRGAGNVCVLSWHVRD